MSIVKFLNEIKEPKVSELGGKGYSLAMIINNGFNVPKGFVITADAFFEYLKQNNLMEKIQRLSSEINEDNFQEKSEKIKDLVLSGKIPEGIALEIEKNLNKLNIPYVAIRSSAVSEDSRKASFAGLHDTFLNVKADLDTVLENVKKCWASLFNERAVLYRMRKDILHLEGMAVIVQELIPADIAGTAFTAHPDTGDKNAIIIEATWGLGESLVSGSVTPDSYIVDKKSLKIIKQTLGRKKMMVKTNRNGTRQRETSKDKRNVFCLNNALVKELAQICLNIEKFFNYPQDIEWCIKDNQIWILQSRPITSLKVK